MRKRHKKKTKKIEQAIRSFTRATENASKAVRAMAGVFCEIATAARRVRVRR